MGLILNLIYWFLNIFLFALIARLILDYVRMFKPDWRPKGAVLAAARSFSCCRISLFINWQTISIHKTICSTLTTGRNCPGSIFYSCLFCSAIIN